MNWRILTGDVREQLQTVEAGSVRCCVTSPPYWGLRDYGTAVWDGGDPACQHGPRVMGNANKGAVREVLDSDLSRCYHCGARRIDSQIGLEPTPDAYVASLVAVFSDVRRVLADDGTAWLNLGDSYNNVGGLVGGGEMAVGRQKTIERQRSMRQWAAGLKPKDLVGIPWRVAFALQADGWYLRSDIIWSKPNPMPESVTDRPTKAHEYIFLLSKSARYYYDAEAIKEGYSEATIKDQREGRNRWQNGGGSDESRSGDSAQNFGTMRYSPDNTRNKRSVWHVATQPYPDAHFATYPEDLIKPCILAGSAPGDLVLDPFCGSGTTGAVAIRHQRRFLGVELNPAYVELARKRIGQVAPLFSSEQTA